MSTPTRILLYAMISSFSLSILGLLAGMAYTLFTLYSRHLTLESSLSQSISYHKAIGALGILGMILFFAFLLSAASSRRSPPPKN